MNILACPLALRGGEVKNLKTILTTSSDVSFWKMLKNSIAHRKPRFLECILCTKTQHHRILQKSPIGFRLLTKPSLSFFYMWDMIKHPYLKKWPFLTAFKTTQYWGMPRLMIKNSPFSRRINASWFVSFCQSYFTKSKQYVSALPTEYSRL